MRSAQDARRAVRCPRRRSWSRLRRQGDALRLTFPFAQPTPAAVFRRCDTLWLVFDSQAPIDVGQDRGESGRGIRNATVTRSREGQVVQLKLERPKLTSAGADGPTWTMIARRHGARADAAARRHARRCAPSRASVAIPFEEPRAGSSSGRPEVGDTLLVVTALGPARGFLRPQEFVEFSALASTHGVVIQPLADDVASRLLRTRSSIGRPDG